MKIKTLLICWLPSFIVVFAFNGFFHTSLLHLILMIN